MIDLEKEREALVNEIELFIKESMECFVVEVWVDSYASIDSAFSHHITSDGEVFFLREQARQLWEFWKKRAEPAQAEITELKQQIEGLKDLNIELQYSRQRVRVELSDLEGEFILIKQKLEKIESGEFVLVPREPTLEMLKVADKHVMDCHATPESAYKVMIEAVEKDHE